MKNPPNNVTYKVKYLPLMSPPVTNSNGFIYFLTSMQQPTLENISSLLGLSPELVSTVIVYHGPFTYMKRNLFHTSAKLRIITIGHIIKPNDKEYIGDSLTSGPATGKTLGSSLSLSAASCAQPPS